MFGASQKDSGLGLVVIVGLVIETVWDNMDQNTVDCVRSTEIPQAVTFKMNPTKRCTVAVYCGGV